MALGPAVGPWVCPDLDSDFASQAGWNAGDVVEVQCYDNDGNEQGKGLLVINDSAGKARLYEATMVTVEDEYYDYWLFSAKGTRTLASTAMRPGRATTTRRPFARRLASRSGAGGFSTLGGRSQICRALAGSPAGNTRPS